MNRFGVAYRISYDQCHLVTENISDATIETYGRLAWIVPDDLPHRDILTSEHKNLFSFSIAFQMGIHPSCISGRPSCLGAATTIAGIELLRRIGKSQFFLRRLRLKDQAAPAIWNAVLAA